MSSCSTSLILHHWSTSHGKIWVIAELMWTNCFLYGEQKYIFFPVNWCGHRWGIIFSTVLADKNIAGVVGPLLNRVSKALDPKIFIWREQQEAGSETPTGVCRLAGGFSVESSLCVELRARQLQRSHHLNHQLMGVTQQAPRGFLQLDSHSSCRTH